MASFNNGWVCLRRGHHSNDQNKRIKIFALVNNPWGGLFIILQTLAPLNIDPYRTRLTSTNWLLLVYKQSYIIPNRRRNIWPWYIIDFVVISHLITMKTSRKYVLFNVYKCEKEIVSPNLPFPSLLFRRIINYTISHAMQALVLNTPPPPPLQSISYHMLIIEKGWCTRRLGMLQFIRPLYMHVTPSLSLSTVFVTWVTYTNGRRPALRDTTGQCILRLLRPSHPHATRRPYTSVLSPQGTSPSWTVILRQYYSTAALWLLAFSEQILNIVWFWSFI